MMKDVVINMADRFSRILQSDEFREEFFVAEAQARLEALMEEKGVTRAELSRKLNVSRARVTQIFSDDASNLTLRLLARSFLALGEVPVIIPASEYARLRRQAVRQGEKFSGQSLSSGSEHLLTASLIAEALRNTDSFGPSDIDRTKRQSDIARKWVEYGPTVVPLRRAANA